MRATGILRRIDDLGRVVIPKEIRRQMNIKVGDPLEVFVDDNKVCFARYSPIDSEKWETALRIAKVMLPNTNFALLNRYGEVEQVIGTKTVTIDNEYYSAEIRVDGEVEGYIHALEPDVSHISFIDTAKVLSALFAEEG